MDLPGIANAPGGDGSDIGAVEVGSLLRVLDIQTQSARVNVSFTTEGPFAYHLESKEMFAPGPWTFVPGSARTGSGAVLTVPDTRPRVSKRFYRAVMTP